MKGVAKLRPVRRNRDTAVMHTHTQTQLTETLDRYSGQAQ